MMRGCLTIIFIICCTAKIAASVCVPAPFYAIYSQEGSCPDNIPIKIAADIRGMQITTTLSNCTENKFDIYSSFLGKIPELQLGDYFEYTVWWSENNTQCIADLYYYNGTSSMLREKGLVDQNGIQQHPLITAVGQYAYGQWYTRRIPLPWDAIGVVDFVVQVVCNAYQSSGTAGTKTAWFKSIRFIDSNLNLRKPIMDSSVLPAGCISIDMCDSSCTDVCNVISDCTCDSPVYNECANNITCIEAPTCSCARGYSGAKCDQPVCSNGCARGEYCAAPEVCQCDESILGQCSQECALPKPSEASVCRVVDGNPTWVFNQTTTVNGNETLAVNDDVLVIGNIVLTEDSVVVVSNGAVITVTGCPSINGSLSVNLNPAELSTLDTNGAVNRTVLLYDAACKDTGDFLSVGVQNTPDDCSLFLVNQQNIPGSMVVLVTKKNLLCNDAGTNPNALLIPDWAIAVLVVGSVVIAGIVATISIVVRKKRLENQLRNASESVSHNARRQ